MMMRRMVMKKMEVARGCVLATRATFDDQNRLFLSGRFKEVINRAGEKVSPLTVEHALLDVARSRLSGLVSLLVFATPHEELGETVGCAVTLETKSGKSSSKSSGSSSSSAAAAAASLTLKQLRAIGLKRAAISPRWLPEMLLILDALPKGPTGKPMRIGLAEKLDLPILSFERGRMTIDRRASAMEAAAAARRRRRSTKRKQWQSGTTAASSSSCRRGYWPYPSHRPLLHRPHTPFNTQSQRQSSRS